MRSSEALRCHRRACWSCAPHLEKPSPQLSQKDTEVPRASRSGADRPALRHGHAKGTEVTSGSRCQATGRGTDSWLPGGVPEGSCSETLACKPQSERQVCLETNNMCHFVAYSVLHPWRGPAAQCTLACGTGCHSGVKGDPCKVWDDVVGERHCESQGESQQQVCNRTGYRVKTS